MTVRIMLKATPLTPIILLACCAGPQDPDYTVAQQRQLLSSIAAERIDIDGPFTQPASFDDDAVPDGIEVVIRAFDQQGEQTKIAGHLVFELYTFREASADPKGRQLQTWQVSLAGRKDQDTYWDHITRTYEFPLQVNVATMPKDRRFVLLARYSNPWNEHLEDQSVIDLSKLISQIKADLQSARTP